MMKFIKSVFKPFRAVIILIAIGFLSVLKKAILAFGTNAQCKNVVKLDQVIRKMYALVFNPYRVCNGIRPNLVYNHKPSAFDIEQCHQFIQSKKQASAECR